MTDLNERITKLINERPAPDPEKQALHSHVAALNVRYPGESPDPATERLLEIEADLRQGSPVSDVLERGKRPLVERYIPFGDSTDRSR